jgi:hypothetical protein
MVALNSPAPRPAPRPRRKAKPANLAASTVRLEITLRYIEPRIWRSFEVPGDITLDCLHDVIQVVMGWTNSHLHSFRKGKHEYLQYHPGNDAWQESYDDTQIHDESEHTLRDLVTARGNTFTYTYDFGDNWTHVVKAVKIDPAAKRLKQARCLEGERACPPEDCGSIPGYCDLIEAWPDPKHPRHAELHEWLEVFEPELFACAEVNRQLRNVQV